VRSNESPGRGRDDAPASRPDALQPEAARVYRSTAFSRAPSLLATTLAENVRLPFVPVAKIPDPGPSPLGSRISLTDAVRGVGVEIRVIASHASARIVAEAIFGDPAFCDEATIADALHELANATMGVFQAELRREGYELTAGLPAALGPASDDGSPRGLSAPLRILAFHAEGATITFALSAQPTRPRTLRATELKDGMVLVAPVHAGTGEVLGKPGARISEVFIERLRALDPELPVELCEAFEP
jgi:hypothetical protein